MAAPKTIDSFEITRYWDIFTSLLPSSPPPTATTTITGSQASSVLRNSGLTDTQLERVWDLSDVDGDGNLDFPEFCVAMRLVFDLVNGELGDVPTTLPDWLVPEGKAHLVQAARGISGGGEEFERPQDDDDDEDDGGRRLKDGFDWYIAPAQKREYEDIYSSSKDGHGYVNFEALNDLYNSLHVPDTDVRSAWNLVNPAADSVIGKDACLAFLHILRGRHDGYRLPRTVPPSLRASFERGGVDYNVERVRGGKERFAVKADDNTSTGRKTKFGDAYLSRLGGSSGGNAPKGTDFSGKTTEDWEEVRLRKQLKELEGKMKKVEQGQRDRDERKGGRRGDSTAVLVKRELEQLLEFKRSEMRALESGEGRGYRDAQGLKRVREEVDEIGEQVRGLEAHLKGREEVLKGLRADIEKERGR